MRDRLSLLIKLMSDRKAMQFSQNKKHSQEDEPRQSHSSLDRIQKKTGPAKLTNTLKQKKTNGLLFRQEEKHEQKKGNSEEWPSTNKRRYLKNYQLPKINSPAKQRKQEMTEYQNQHQENLIDDEEKLKEVLHPRDQQPEQEAATRPAQAEQQDLPHGCADQGRAQRPADQDKPGRRHRGIEAAPQPEALLRVRRPRPQRPPGLRLHQDCPDQENLNGPLKKFHNPPEKEKLVEIIYLALSTTNTQLLQCEINTELAGSTLIAVFVYNERLLAFNVGDSRAILLQERRNELFKREGAESSNNLHQLSHVKVPEEYEWSVFPLSVDQKPERPDEKQRILKFGGRVFAQTNENGEQLGPARVWMKDVMMPGLAMTRSFGDKAGIKSGTNAEPELIEHEIESCDKLIVVASDGVWEYLESEQVMSLLTPFLNRNDLNGAAECLLKRSVEMWGKMNFARDDITFILVKLNEVEE